LPTAEQTAAETRLFAAAEATSGTLADLKTHFSWVILQDQVADFLDSITTDKTYGQVLGQVRRVLGHDINFAVQSDREAFGNALIQHIRQPVEMT
jgi:hypothetical protein